MTPAVGLAALSAGLGGWGLAELALSFAGSRRSRARSTHGPRLAIALARLGRRLGAPAAPTALAQRIERAGAPGSLGVADVMALKCGAAAVALLASVPVVAAAPGRLGILVVVTAPAAGFLAPDLWLVRRTRRRCRTMAAELPGILDLLVVAVEAGLSPTRAVAEVGRRHGGPLAAELRAAAARIELGVARADALALLALRSPVEGVEALVAALGRSERHGVALGPALCALAEDARAVRARGLRERAARAAPKIQLVVALLLVPAAMLLVGAAMVAGMR